MAAAKSCKAGNTQGMTGPKPAAYRGVEGAEEEGVKRGGGTAVHGRAGSELPTATAT